MKFPTKYNHLGYDWLEKIEQGFHPGIDYNFGQSRDDEGQDIYSITNGEVIYMGSDKGWGMAYYN